MSKVLKNILEVRGADTLELLIVNDNGTQVYGGCIPETQQMYNVLVRQEHPYPEYIQYSTLHSEADILEVSVAGITLY